MAHQGDSHPGAVQHAPHQWKPGMGGSPKGKKKHGDKSDSDSDDDSHPKPLTIDVTIAGYGNMGPVGQMAAQSPPTQPPASGSPPDVHFDEISHLDESVCRDAVIHFSSQNCCYGKAPAKDMVFHKCIPMTALHYTLETFGEMRSVGYKAVPFKGGSVDGPEHGQPPPPWAIQCEPSKMFNDHAKHIEVPHTSVLRPCNRCSAKGYIKCSKCKGKGKVKCDSCKGEGKRQAYDAEGNAIEQDCPYCHKGKVSCKPCGADGKVKCPVCDGYQQLRCYIELKVEFKNHFNDYILEQTDMPDELVRTVSGKPVFEQTLPQIWPIVAYPMAEVNTNSQKLVNLHRTTYTAERVIMQRQVLRAVPVTEVNWEWKDQKNKRLWVYGNEHKVYCPDYPQKCCWGCTVQ